MKSTWAVRSVSPTAVERALHDSMAAIAEQRAGEVARAVQLGGLVAVVDGDDEPASQAARHLVQPRGEAEADLADLALGQLFGHDPVVRETGRELGRGRLARDLDEALPPRDEEFAQPPAADDEAVDRHGVEELVGKDDAGDGHGPTESPRGSRRSRQPPGVRQGRPFRSRSCRSASRFGFDSTGS